MSIASPCVNICRMDPASGLCVGCLRTLAEIAAWGSASDTEKQAVLVAIAGRRASQPGGPGGSALTS